MFRSLGSVLIFVWIDNRYCAISSSLFENGISEMLSPVFIHSIQFVKFKIALLASRKSFPIIIPSFKLGRTMNGTCIVSFSIVIGSNTSINYLACLVILKRAVFMYSGSFSSMPVSCWLRVSANVYLFSCSVTCNDFKIEKQ